MLLIAAAIIALSASLFQYYTKAKGDLLRKSLFAFLRFLSIFTLLVLLINPKIKSVETTIIKPKIVVAVDNSKSIDYIKQKENVLDFLNVFSNDKVLKNKFEIENYTFGNTFQDSIVTFTEKQTKITEALGKIQQLHRKKNTATVLLTDGNQTYGSNYAYYKTKYRQPIYAVAFGDTTTYNDISITKVNANKYAYLGNEFPVEVLVNYQGDKNVTQQLSIKQDGKIVYKTSLTFTTNKKSQFINTFLSAKTSGISNYSIQISSLDKERYLENNNYALSVDIIDQKQDVLLITDIKHPDIGAIHRMISSNERNSFEISKPSKVKNIGSYELIIAYQPKTSFKNIFTEIEIQNIPLFIVTGKSTDWNFLNNSNWGFTKKIANQTEEIFPVLGKGFESFNTDSFNLDDLSPLESVFGEVNLEVDYESLLLKKIAGVTTNQPLLSFWENKALLQGEGLWKWRLLDFKVNKNFENIDGLFQKTFQFLANKKSKQRLLLDYKRINYTNSPITINASYFNKSFEFDAKKRLNATLSNVTNGQKFNQPFLLKNNYYELDVSNLPQGSYTFKVSVSGTAVQKTGYFSIIDFDIENQFYSPNIKDLQRLTKENQGNLFFQNQFEALRNNLLQNPNLKPIQKSKTRNIDLIDWRYLLGFLILFLSIEWFLRKYSGLV